MQLIQREWLDGGHPFSIRHNHVTSAPEKEKAPIFLLFLDAVWQVCATCTMDTRSCCRVVVNVSNNNLFPLLQVMQQFPLSFEFNERFLHTLFVHSYSSAYGKAAIVNASSLSSIYKEFISTFTHANVFILFVQVIFFTTHQEREPETSCQRNLRHYGKSKLTHTL